LIWGRTIQNCKALQNNNFHRIVRAAGWKKPCVPGFMGCDAGLFASHERLFASHEGLFASHEGLFASRERLFASRERLFASREGLFSSHEGLIASPEELQRANGERLGRASRVGPGYPVLPSEPRP
jgi:hypothetical protein